MVNLDLVQLEHLVTFRGVELFLLNMELVELSQTGHKPNCLANCCNSYQYQRSKILTPLIRTRIKQMIYIMWRFYA